MSHNMDIFEETIRHHQSIFMVKIFPILLRPLDCLLHQSRVFRMNSLEDQFHSRCHGWVVLEDSKSFL